MDQSNIRDRRESGNKREGIVKDEEETELFKIGKVTCRGRFELE